MRPPSLPSVNVPVNVAALALVAFAALALPACTREGQLAVAAPSPARSPAAAPATAATTATADGVGVAPGAPGLPLLPEAAANDHGDRGAVDPGASFIGARAVHDVVLASDGQADIGVWVDAPALRRTSWGARRPGVDVALVIDVSGSMSGAKFHDAKEAARTLVAGLVDGDIVSIDSFDDRARTVCPPLVLDAQTRQTLGHAIDAMIVGGNTNMFDGLELAEMHAAQAPATHAVRRVVMLSDGQANVGPSSPELLGAIAERGLAARTQVTSIGLGLDYSEQTLDALAVRSAGRMYHLTDSAGVPAMLRDEVALLTSAVASDAYVEVIPAAGVRVERILGVGGWHGEATASSDGGRPTLRIPLGSLFAGQHREALLRVRFEGGGAAWRAQPRALASVRLHFRDLGDDSVERVQETVARIRTSDDAREVAASAQPQAQAIAATALANEEALAATQDAEKGDFVVASRKLAVMSAELRQHAASAPAAARPRMLKAASDADDQSRAVGAAASSAPAARRETVLKMNSYGMKASGF